MSNWNNPGMTQVGPTEPVSAPRRWLPLLLDELVDHLLPWSANAFRQRLTLTALSLGAALAVTAVWILAASGEVRQAVVIGWWTGWSAFEVLVRMQCKPWVKEGPWWRRGFRAANWMDMISYVSFKNLLIGAALFLALKWLGVLVT